jgi:FAD/FMN-containing dehydrogenase
MSDVVQQRPPCEPLVPPGGFELLARDMTATFSADCTLQFAQEKLAEIGQWLPVDGDPAAPLQTLIEQNSTGPLRLGYGGWRDLLLGAQFTNGNRELITAGGRTVKNVAGYDLTKFMVGGHGIFGRLVTFTSRTHGLPDGALLVRHAADPAKLTALLPTPLRPQWSLLTRETLLCGYLGDEATLAWYEANVRGSEPMEIQRRSVRDDIDHRASLWKTGITGIPFRASIPPSKLKTFVNALNDSIWAADPAFGIVLGSAKDESRRQLREAANSLGGSARFGSTALDLDVSTNPAERQIIERLKTAFDPDNRLEPLPWQRR